MENKLTGVESIAKEREKHYKENNCHVEDDVEHNKRGELTAAAHLLISYTENDSDFINEKCSLFFLATRWNEVRLFKMMHKPYKERLIIAGALIAAEIDRLNYIENEQ